MLGPESGYIDWNKYHYKPKIVKCEFCGVRDTCENSVGSFKKGGYDCCAYCYRHYLMLRPLGYRFTKEKLKLDLEQAILNYNSKSKYSLSDVIKKYNNLPLYENDNPWAKRIN